MKTKIEAIWDDSIDASTAKDSSELDLRRISTATGTDIYAGSDGKGDRLFAIGVMTCPPAIDMKSGSFEYFRVTRKTGGWLMCLRLTASSVASVFGKLCQDLADEASEMDSDAAVTRLFHDRLLLWKKLFERNGNGLLSNSEIKGLIAELLVFRRLLHESVRSSVDIAFAWVGPLGADNDYAFADVSLEVKAVGPEAPYVTISSLQQLGGPVESRLIVIPMRPAPGADELAVNLNKLTRAIEGEISSDIDALREFRKRLLSSGYVEDEFYDSIAFVPQEFEVFRISEDFPRLTTQSVPKGILAARYDIALDYVRENFERYEL